MGRGHVGSSPCALPTDEDVRFYETHGWWISPVILPDELLDLAEDAAETFYREGCPPLPGVSGYSNWTPADGYNVLRNNEFVWMRSPGLAALARHPTIGAVAARLARTEEIRMLDDQLVWKPGRDGVDGGAVGWHADKAYWGTCASDRLLTAWIPFHDVDETRGALSVVDGSHLWGVNGHLRGFNDRDLDGALARIARGAFDVRQVTLTLRRGQVSFHHAWTVHASHPNTHSSPRLALAVHLQDRENSYVPCFGPDGRPVHIVDERLCRRRDDGSPDFADPAIFPRIWPVQ